MRRRWGTVGAVASAFLAMVAAIVVLFAAPASARSDLAIEVGYGGNIHPSRSFPVRVSVTTDRLIRGFVEVTARSAGGPGDHVVVRLPVEVPATGVKSYIVVVPPVMSFPGAPLSVTARLTGDGGTERASTDAAAVRTSEDRELVGLFPGVLAGAAVPAAKPLAVEGGVAEFFALGEAEFAHAPASLEPLGTIALLPAELVQLAPERRRALLTWVSRGGTLLVDAAPGAPVDGLPAQWQPAESGRASAGLGRIVLTSGRAAAGAWDGMIYPTPASTPGDPRFGPFGGPQSIGDSLARDAGLRVPQFGWLLAFLLIYTAIVGPVVGIVLNRRRRAELAWIVIPLVAVVFSSASWGAARGLRANTTLGRGEVIEVSPIGSVSTSFVGVVARNPLDALVRRDGTTWTAARVSSGFDAGGRSEVMLGEHGPSVALDLASGQFAVTKLVGPSNIGGLAVTAESSDDGKATGAVRNDTGHVLEEVVVFVGATAARVGRVEAGAERAWAIDASAPALRRNPWESVDTRMWLAPDGGRIDLDSDANHAAWSAATPLAGATRPSGLAVAVGWTRDLGSPVSVDGSARTTRGRTAIVASAPVQPTARVTDMTVRGEPLRASSAEFRGGANARNLASMIRFLLPDARSPRGPLVATVPMGGGTEVWDGGRWVLVGGEPSEAPQGPGVVDRPMDPLATLDVSIPGTAVVDGQVFVRVANPGGAVVAGTFTMRERA